MPIERRIAYGPGGFRPDRPDRNVIEDREVDVPDLPPTAEERIEQLEAELAGIRERVANANSIADLKAAIRGSDAPGRSV